MEAEEISAHALKCTADCGKRVLFGISFQNYFGTYFENDVPFYCCVCAYVCARACVRERERETERERCLAAVKGEAIRHVAGVEVDGEWQT
jgi:hypothetical protein